MSTPELPSPKSTPMPNPQPDDWMDAQLQQELRGLFEMDTQKSLQTYIDRSKELQPQSWKHDIQTLYRAIHTIKGGAVTVGADAILQVSIVLEDLLSDLRLLEAAPSLADGRLQEMLVEAGELLASTLSIEVQGAAARAQVEPSVQRIQELRSQLQQSYLPQWNEQTQIQQEFARQGLDLVVLDLTIALEQLADATTLPESILPIAQSLIERLDSIGQDLQLETGWGMLLNQASTLIEQPDIELWRSQWPRLFQAFKNCARAGGKPASFGLSDADVSDQFLDPLPLNEHGDQTATIGPFHLDSDEADPMLTDIHTFLDDLGNLAPSITGTELPPTPIQEIEDDPVEVEADSHLLELNQTNGFGLFPGSEAWVVESSATPTVNGELDAAAQVAGPSSSLDDSDQSVQVPVPLERLDQSAQALITALLSSRSSQGLYQVLHQQIGQLVALAQEGTEHIVRLRQIQDDYALLENLKPYQQRQTGPVPERYRQGYTTINRLLETSLRLSELGAEAEKSARQMQDSLQFLDESILKLQTTVEASRLMPFRTLAFRARAILRDLATRYQKPARLVIHGERTELDVGSARSLEPALLHLIRNAFDHALESPEERRALGKPEQGTLILSLKRQGNTYRLTIQDDGRGLNPRAIRERAQALGLPQQDTSTPAGLLAVICQPGFSSEDSVSEISGRGVGMDVVANQISRMGGTITLETGLGQGTTFHLQFPVSHLLEPCVLLQAGDRSFAIPADDIKNLALLETLETTPVDDPGSIYTVHVEADATSLPGLDLMTYWQPQTPRQAPKDSTICAQIQSDQPEQGLWLLADDLLGQADLLITPLPQPLQTPAGLIGVSLQPDGSQVPVLSATALADWLAQTPPESVADLSGLNPVPQQPPLTANPTILVVDDAALMRRRLEASLSACGHSIHTCSDGLEAWNWLQANPSPALVITDIEMPNMDGFTLIDRCRRAGIEVPVLVVSSRLSEDWFDEARRLGASDYLTKGFSTLELVQKVDQLITPLPSPFIQNPQAAAKT